LALQWEVARINEVFKAITPPVKPSLPVAVDLARMHTDSGGTGVLVPFNSRADHYVLEREITSNIAEKEASALDWDLQRRLVRKTVTGFVTKWRIQQESWKVANQPRIKLEFGA
jgi:YD repeat-containing protein